MPLAEEARAGLGRGGTSYGLAPSREVLGRAIEQAACVMRLTPAYLGAVATFYDMFSTVPKGRHDVYVCTNISCSLRGADALNVHRVLALMDGEIAEGSEAKAAIEMALFDLAGRVLADLILGHDSELARLPMVNRRPRRWEPEPLRWLAVRYLQWSLARLDTQAARRGRPPSGRTLAERLVRH